MERLSRRKVLHGMLVVSASGIGSAILAACSGGASSPPAAASQPTAAASNASAAPTTAAAAPTQAAALTSGTQASAATPAAQPAASGAAVTLTMWKGPHKPAGDESKQIANPTLAKFTEANPTIKVDFSEVPWAEYQQKFTTAFAAGRGPDVSYQTESFPTFVNAGNILQLDDLMKTTNFDKDFFYPQSWTTATYSGKLFAVPWILGGSNLFWNKDLFEKAGLDPDKPPDTMDDFVNYAKKLTNGDVYGFATPSKDTHENGQWPRRFGGDWFSKDLSKCVADSKEALAGFQFLDDLFHKQKVAMPAAIVDQQPGLLGYFEAGKIGMITAQNTSANTI
ncbi:MAG TPA: sugar ABC transporter substrate-binding protein, partial [Chloroflexota bacterium]|nr:sugar ABC transporter substrate-binding protein [Chloroflexota bacterium]